METSVHDAQSAAPLPIRVGSSQAEVIAHFGDPRETLAPNDSTTILQYATMSEGATDHLQFHVVEDLIRKVVWDYYVD